MTSAIERAIAHFTGKKDNPRCVEVPEWGEDGAPFLIFVKPLNLKQRSAIGEEHRRDPAGAIASTIIAAAVSAEGEPLFSREDKPRLKMHVDATVAARIADQIIGDADDIPTGEDPEGN